LLLQSSSSYKTQITSTDWAQVTLDNAGVVCLCKVVCYSSPMPHKQNVRSHNLSVPVELIERRIYLIRGQKVMIDFDLAELYGVPTKQLNQQVSRNQKRFPEDFMFQLTKEEGNALRSQFVTSNPNLKSEVASSKTGRGGRRYLPYAFTEQGVAMLSSVIS